MKKVYIVLTHTGTVLSRLIQRYTKSPYTHVSISLDERLEELYSFGRKHPKNPIIAGFVKEDIRNGVYHHFPRTRCEVYELCVTKTQYKKIARILRSFQSPKKRYHYNIFGLIGYVFQYPVEWEGFYFCSQFVSEVLIRAGMDYWGKPPSLISPDDVRSCDALTLRYRGGIHHYDALYEKSS